MLGKVGCCSCQQRSGVRGLRGEPTPAASAGVRAAVGLGIAGVMIIGMLTLVTR